MNGYTNVVIIEKAILPKNFNAQFYSTDSSKEGFRLIRDVSDNSFTIPVEVDSVDLDSFCDDKTKITFMKIDVDGPELLVLESARKLLRNQNIRLLIEWDKMILKNGFSDPEKMIDLILENGFRIYYPDFKNEKYVLVEKNELLNLQSNDTINLLCRKD